MTEWEVALQVAKGILAALQIASNRDKIHKAARAVMDRFSRKQLKEAAHDQDRIQKLIDEGAGDLEINKAIRADWSRWSS